MQLKLWSLSYRHQELYYLFHCEKYRVFTWFPGVGLLRKDSFCIVSVELPETIRKL